MTSWRSELNKTKANRIQKGQPLQKPKKSFVLHKAVEYKNLHKMRILLPETDTCEINEKNDKGYTVLLLACEQDRNEDVLDLLLTRNDIDITITNNDKFTALHILAFRGNLKGIQKIMDKFSKVDIDALNDKENTPLIMASKMDHVDVIEYLAAKGANVQHKNDKKFTALHYTANNGYTRSLMALIRLGADINAKDDYGLTPLMKTCKWGFLGTCEILLQKGADVNYSTKTEFTALRAACFRDNVELVRLLISHGADVNYPGKFSTALFECAKNGNVACAEALINANAHVNRKIKTGKSVLDIARNNKKFKMVDFLKKYFNEP